MSPEPPLQIGGGLLDHRFDLAPAAPPHVLLKKFSDFNLTESSAS